MFNTSILSKLLYFGIPAFMWFKFFRKWFFLHKNFKNAQLFDQRHNCVVMYSKHRGSRGWLDNTQPCSNQHLYNSIAYFIRTATKSIDIAMMLIDSNVIVKELQEASKRNIKIRILLDYNYNTKSAARDLKMEGIEIKYFVCPQANICSILHYKYMIKDFVEGKGCLYLGSLNWSTSGFQDNYENTVFLTNNNVAQAFYKNFNEAWEIIDNINKNNLFAKAVLRGIC